jgi:hypothetical protein
LLLSQLSASAPPLLCASPLHDHAETRGGGKAKAKAMLRFDRMTQAEAETTRTVSAPG